VSAARATRGALALLLLAVACTSVGSIFVRLAQAPPLSVAFYRVFLAAVVLAPFAGPALARAWPSVPRRPRLLVLASGGALGLHFATWIASLDHTSVASSVLLVNTSPLFSLALSRVFLREAVTPAVMAATGLCLTGVGLIAAGDWGHSPSSLLGNGLALAGAATQSAYHVIGRGLRAALPLNAYVLGVWSAAALTLAGSAAVAGSPFTGHSTRALACFAVLALVPTLGGHGLVNRSLRVFSAPTVALFLLGEPVGATVLAYLVFGERPGRWTLAGGALVLAGLGVLLLRER
jgi:drug/metabolite transporter (DMT)-like permease